VQVQVYSILTSKGILIFVALMNALLKYLLYLRILHDTNCLKNTIEAAILVYKFPGFPSDQGVCFKKGYFFQFVQSTSL
jgi:hypothetical protein